MHENTIQGVLAATVAQRLSHVAYWTWAVSARYHITFITLSQLYTSAVIKAISKSCPRRTRILFPQMNGFYLIFDKIAQHFATMAQCGDYNEWAESHRRAPPASSVFAKCRPSARAHSDKRRSINALPLTVRVYTTAVVATWTIIVRNPVSVSSTNSFFYL